jgi:hypothetical protein
MLDSVVFKRYRALPGNRSNILSRRLRQSDRAMPKYKNSRCSTPRISAQCPISKRALQVAYAELFERRKIF